MTFTDLRSILSSDILSSKIDVEVEPHMEAESSVNPSVRQEDSILESLKKDLLEKYVYQDEIDAEESRILRELSQKEKMKNY